MYEHLSPKQNTARKEFSSSQMPRLGVCTRPAGGFLKRFARHCTILLVATIVTTAPARINSPVNVEILLLEPAPVDVLPGHQIIRQPQMNYIAPVLHSLQLLVLKNFPARYELRTMVQKHLSSWALYFFPALCELQTKIPET
jgi:hypothetical protein